MSIKRVVNHPVVVVLLGIIVAIPFVIGFVAGLVIVPMAAGYCIRGHSLISCDQIERKSAPVVEALRKGRKTWESMFPKISCPKFKQKVLGLL